MEVPDVELSARNKDQGQDAASSETEKTRLLQQHQHISSTPSHSQDANHASHNTNTADTSAVIHHQSHSLLSEVRHVQHELHLAASAAHQYAVQHHRMLTTLLIAITRVLENTDASLLPAVYMYVGCAFAATPAQLGAITFTRLLTSSFASPLGGFLGHKFNRARLVAATCWYWAVCTTLFAYSSSTWQGVVIWAFNGIGLGIMIPNAQSLIADYYDATHRGRAFGMLLAVGNLGAMLASVYATNIGGLTILGLQGWRFAFLTVAVISAVAGGAMWAFARDPRCISHSWTLDPHWQHNNGSNSVTTAVTKSTSHSSSGVLGVGKQVWGSVKRFWTSPLAVEARVVITTPSFLVVVVQGVLGSMPWGAFAFSTLYFQLQGWSDAAASTVMALFSAADAAGAFLGGVVGDWAAARFPNHGRIAACQFSVGIGVPICLLIFQGLPLGSSGGVFFIYAVLLGLMGLLISWAATACNNPIFAEIVPPHLRTLVYAFDRCFEGALSAVGAPMVGVAAQRLFGFQGTAASADCSSLASHAARQHQPDFVKARALGNALTLFSTVPWTLCALVYSLLHCTYPRDKKRSQCTGDPIAPVEQFSALPSTELEASAVEWTPHGLPAVLQKVDDVINQVDDYISNPRLNTAAAPAGAGAAVVSEVELHDWENEVHHNDNADNREGGLGRAPA